MNAAAEQLTGFPTVQARGATLTSLFRIIDPETGLETTILAAGGKAVAYRSQLLVRADSTSVAVSVAEHETHERPSS